MSQAGSRAAAGNAGRAAALVVSCEHASHAVPPGLDLGVDEAVLRSHVSWDHGAAEVAFAVAAAFEAPLFLGACSRLVADLNRAETNPCVVPAVSFGTPVPGNAGLAAHALEERLARYHRPYRRAVEDGVRAALEDGRACLHFSSHSFTPVLGADVREVELGVLFDPDHALEAAVAEALLAGLRERGFDARPNEPYAGTADGLTTHLRGLLPRERYAGIELETSHALTERPGGIERVVAAVCAVVPRALEAAAGRGARRRL